MKRSEKWAAFYRDAPWTHHPDAPPALVHETRKGIWTIQRLVRRAEPSFSWLHRLLNDPPKEIEYEPYYNFLPYPNEDRSFPTKEEARDFYRYWRGLISFEEYCATPATPWSGVQFDLDDEGQFLPASVDTRPKDEDPAQTGASLASGAVGEAETPNP